MIFNSASFAMFFVIVLLGCLLFQSIRIKESKVRLRNMFLLIASYYFYAFLKWEFVFLLLATTLINYFCPVFIEKNSDNKKIRQLWMWVAVVLSIGILACFKYMNFFIESVNQSLALLGIEPQLKLLKIALPVGISFFTFQALTYTLDVYKHKISVCHNFINVALSISFFPTILSGPIEKARNLLPQIETPKNINIDILVEGGKRFLWGLFKKVVIADRLALYINEVYAVPEYHSGVTLIITAILYSFQIYADFSGYSDMAIGIAQTLGFRLQENFKYPYFSTSIKEFWKRWHISLTSWFMEYVYIPLGGNRVTQNRWIFNILVVFLLSGFWHGASWTFILWGLLHAIFYITEFFYKKTEIYQDISAFQQLKGINKALSVLFIFSLVTIAWIFFRIENINQVQHIFVRFFTERGHFSLGGSAFSTALSILLLLFFIFLDWIKYKEYSFSPLTLAVGYALILCLILLFGVNTGGFVYFQF